MASSSGNKDSSRSVPWWKKPKVTIIRVQETQDDRISQLPDSLLIQILSLLPTEEAYRTSFLSKRWQNLWTSVYNFNFDCTSPTFVRRLEENFGSFVDYVLAHSISSQIKKFELHFNCAHFSNINRWLSFAVERRVEDVVLRSRVFAVIPECFCTCSSLITLDITCCEFISGIPISWNSLKSIKVEDMWLSDNEIVKILAGSPALETMELSGVERFHRLEINTSKLKRLYLKDPRVVEDSDEDERDTPMEIFAPYLQQFGISGDLQDVKFKLLDVSSLVNANLTFTNRCFDETCYLSDDDKEGTCHDYHQGFITLVQHNLQKLCCVTELTLGSWFTEVLCMLQLKGMPIPELKCKYLTLELHIEQFSLYGAVGILRAAPHVETLNIDMSMPFERFRCNFEGRYLAEGHNIDLHSWISSFGFANLKNVKIVNSSGVCLMNHNHFEPGFDMLFKFSEFVLKNATMLEKFVISTRIKCKRCSFNCMSLYLCEMSMKLLCCPRASTNCVFIFE